MSWLNILLLRWCCPVSSVKTISARIEPEIGNVAITGIAGHERLSEPYKYRIRAVSVLDSIEPYRVIDKKFKVELFFTETAHLSDTPQVTLHGYCVKMEQKGKTHDSELFTYEMVLVPKYEYLSNTRHSEVFLEKSPKTIMQSILSRHGMNDATKFWPGVGETPNYEYKVQFEESDYSFCQKVLAEEGIFYYFDRESPETKHVFGDKTSHYLAEAMVNYQSEAHSSYDEYIVHGSVLAEHNPANTVIYRAYNHKSPQSRLNNKTTVTRPTGSSATVAAESELYSFLDSRNYATNERVSKRNTLEKERTAVEGSTVQLECNTISLYPGKTVTIESEEDFVSSEKSLLVVESHWRVDLAPSPSQSTGSRITNTLSCIPKSKVYRPAIPDNARRIPGLQTATVVGQDGAVLDTEGFLRVKVQFHWDKKGKNDRNSSCWIRVTQGIAGEGYGMFFPPRLGQEVVVGFLAGNPDAPILIGSVYNGKSKPPYSYPTDQNRSGFRSRTVEGGTDQYNEVSFEDTSGKEELFLRAQKDMKVEVLDNEKRTVGTDRKNEIGQDDIRKVGRDCTVEIGNNLTEKIAKDHICESTDYSLTNQGQFTHKVNKNYSADVAQDHKITIGKEGKLTVGTTYEVKAGQKVSVEAPQSIEITSPTNIKLTCGGVSIDMKPGLIEIKGLVKINQNIIG